MIENNFDIGITTFSLRYEFVEELVNKIRYLKIKNNIILCINGEQNSKFSDNYRKNILNLCINNENIYPIFFIETRGLSKMWNTIIIHSTMDNILLLNDDLILDNENIFDVTSNHIKDKNYHGLSKINNSFSHFIINRDIIDHLGYFDERLLGFGEEDGDITYRMCADVGVEIQNLTAHGIHNVVSNIRHQYIKSGVGKYSKFNREFIKTKYSNIDAKSGISGMFGDTYDLLLKNHNLYPYDKYFREHKQEL